MKNIYKPIVIIIIILTIFYFLNLYIFLEGKIIESPWFDGGISSSKNLLIGCFSLTLGWLGGTLGTISIILLIYNIEWFYTITIIGQMFTIFDSCITGLFFTSASYLMMIVIVVISTKKANINLNKIILLAIILIWIFLGYIYYLFINPFNFYWLNNIDIIFSSLSILGWWLITKKNRAGYVLFIVNDIIYAISFLFLGLIVVSISFLVYLSINIYCLWRLTLNKI